MNIINDPLFYFAAVPAVLLAGISKGGFAGGLGMLAVPLMALAIPAPQAASVMLPILCLMDLVGSWSYHKHWDYALLRRLIPGAVLGIVLGWLLFKRLDGWVVELFIGLLAVLFAVQRLLAIQLKDTSRLPEWLRASIWSGLSGFTSCLAHAGGPPMMVYLLPKQLDKTVLVANLTLYFALVNYLKLVPYTELGLLDARNLGTAMVLAPLAPIGVYLGIWLHNRIDEKLFYRLSYLFLLATGLRLIWQAI
ncbi:sulfite exporter TauE/SafE family protein [Uliginosibacterium sediminicola]|uniref:Probable membrane transporter protein n=1 Tax=Uliginosibacterium sediminicola TaxID=2024550 RepID=A0ABU9YT45_9RHOO